MIIASIGAFLETMRRRQNKMPYPVRMNLLLESTRTLRGQVASHDVYKHLESLEQVRIFMEHHVFAVWDFMALVKSLQNTLTCTSAVWLPQGDPISRRLINEIVLDEESDDDGDGGYISHFELYLEAMRECGAETTRIRDFMDRVSRGEDVIDALRRSQAPEASQAFVKTTWQIVSSRSPHRIAAAFAIGREEIVPEMFQVMVSKIQKNFPEQTRRFAYYLERHINVDKERHAPMAAKMLERLCGQDEATWQEATQAARIALMARVQLWDAVKCELARLPCVVSL
jgi:hypothetical protein